MLNYIKNTLEVYLQMSPYLLLGFFIAGILNSLIPQKWVQKHLAGNGYSPILKSALLGVPLPLCSCGVIPVMASLRKRGANIPATLSFLLSTPQTGVDSILATYALLGLPLAIYRPVIAFITAIVGGTVYYLLLKFKNDAEVLKIEEDLVNSQDRVNETFTENTNKKSFVINALRYGFLTLPREIALPLFFGVIVAGFVTTFLSPGFIAKFLSHSTLQIILAVLLGIPIYVCATASIPIALGLIHLGITPGAALAFLISGPATNIATIGVVRKFLGLRALVVYVLTMIVSAFFFGFTFDYIVGLFPNSEIFDFGLNSLPHREHLEGTGYIHILSSILLFVVFLLSLNKGRVEYFWNSKKVCNKEPLEILIEGMSCEHCVDRVKNILKSIPRVEEVNVMLSSRKALVYGSPSFEEIKSKLQKEGYGVSLLKPTPSPPINKTPQCSCCK